MSALAGRRTLALGPLRVPAYPVLLWAGCVAGVFAGATVAAAEGLDASRFALATVALLVPALAGARAWFVLGHLAAFRAEPARIWRRGEGGAALLGGLLLAVPLSVPVLAAAGLPFRPFWDAASVTMLCGLILTRVGCLMNGCCAGRPAGGPLGMVLPDHRGEWRRRHPVPLLEAGWAAVVLAAGLLLRPGLPFPGALFALVIAAYGAGRLLLDPLRLEGGGTGGRLNLLASVLLLAGAGALVAAG